MRPIPTLFALILATVNSVGVAASPDANWPEPKRIELAPGILQFITPELAGNVSGNSVAILTDRDIVLFDATLLPASADAVVRQLQQITPKPVRYLVNSHWHPDHTGGNEMFAKRFPGLQIIASQRTRELMQDTASVYVKTLEFEIAQVNEQISQRLKSGKGSDGRKLTQNERDELRSRVTSQERFLTEFRAVQTELPTLTFGDTITLNYGGRELRLSRLPGHTAGDVAAYLPVQRVLLTGDLLVYPVPFCADSHPSEWIASLEALSRLDAKIIIPGHGEAQLDGSYLQLVLNSFRTIRQQVRDALHRGLTWQETEKAIDLTAIRNQFAHGDANLNASFDGNFSPVVRRFYDELTEGLEQYQ
jgi:glyoxylase-like metal-dependent hydrolase (beta-lactamase superfamily II)